MEPNINLIQQLDAILEENEKVLIDTTLINSTSLDETRTRTLLLIDLTPKEESQDYFKARTDVYDFFDAEEILRRSAVNREPCSSILEYVRFRLVYAMKYGKALVVRMGFSMVDFKYTYCDEECPELMPNERHAPYRTLSYLPRSSLMYSGQHLKRDVFVQNLFRNSDFLEFAESNQPVACHKNFRILLTTRVHPDQMDDFLFNRRYGLPGDKTSYQKVRFPI